MSRKSKIIAGVVAAVVAGGGVLAFTVFKEQIGSKIPIIGEAVADDPVCPLSGRKPKSEDLINRPAVAIKVENAQVAYPLSGLDDAEVVYEELVEGGVTRFMAIYHCNDSEKVGPVRSARAVDPAIMLPLTRILAYSGQNAPVLDALQEADIVRIDEGTSEGSMMRIPRAGLTAEHTLYADSAEVREVGQERFEDPPPEEVFQFGDLEGDFKKVETIDITFSELTQVRYVYEDGVYRRFQPTEQPFEMEEGGHLGVENVLIEEHEVNNSKTIRDVNGNPSTEIADETGTGPATLFRDGRMIEGTWSRKSTKDVMEFKTDSGDTMVFSEGSVWIHLLPGRGGELEGSFSFE